MIVPAHIMVMRIWPFVMKISLQNSMIYLSKIDLFTYVFWGRNVTF